MGRSGHDWSEFPDLYAAHGPLVRARCRALLEDRAEAEDVTQETFLSMAAQMRQRGESPEIRAWLLRTATNRCLNILRHGRLGPRVQRRLAGAAVVLEPSVASREVTSRLLGHLPRSLFLTAWLYHVEGRQQSEIALLCQVSRRTVIARLARFAEQARAYLEDI
jgi:RNA polymerase sigma-70 factor (ECF subfamily)